MKNVKERLILRLSDKKIMRRIDYAIFIIAIISFLLIIGKPIFENLLGIPYPININWIAVFLMLSLIFLFSLKMLVDKKTQIAFQMIILVFLMMAMSAVVGIAKHILK